MADSTTRDSGFLERTRADTLPPESFDGQLRQSAYPWNLDPSEYEAEKFDEMLAVLPRARYRTAFEVGCSIGVLTQRLAERCDSLLAVDCSPTAPRRLVADRTRTASFGSTA